MARMPEDKKKYTIRQATQTTHKGLAWNTSDGLIVHEVSGTGHTTCGVSTSGGPLWGWYPSNGNEAVDCPHCLSGKTTGLKKKVPVA